jgi:hypothetical protein
MDVINAAGQHVSLLNHDEPGRHRGRPHALRPRLARAATTHASPRLGPRASPTPQLVRHRSSASQPSPPSPSPMTPTYPFEPLDASKPAPPHDAHDRAPYYAPPAPFPPGLMDDPYGAGFPAAATAFPYATDLITPITPQAALAAASQQPPPPPPPDPSPRGRKKYPCPHAARYACADTFTTSGHAARHGKKHTGEKNIRCPTCNKAFTRKDNMRQHERTHRPAKDAAAAAAARRPAARADDGLADDAAVAHARPAPAAAAADAFRYHGLLPLDGGPPDEARPGFDRKYTGGSQDGEGESPGLDALAMAASGMAG